MPSPKAALKAIASRFFRAIPVSVLQKAEDAVQKQLGKGSGAWSTAEEAKATSEFIQGLGLQEVVAIDAGANVGNWSAEFLKCLPAAQVIAFEPSKVAFSKLSERFANDNRVNCVNSALGKIDEVSTLYSDEGGSGLGSLTKRRVEHFNIDFGHQEKIQVHTLDSWINKNRVKTPNVLKMDVEGHEYDLLLGAKETLRNIKVVQFEFGGSKIDSRTYFQYFWYFFQYLGFTIYRLTPVKPLLIKHYSESDESFRATNYVAIRNNA
jgi:FkbM family methyltransferase